MVQAAARRVQDSMCCAEVPASIAGEQHREASTATAVEAAPGQRTWDSTPSERDTPNSTV